MGNVADRGVIKRLFEAFDTVDFEAIDELLSPDFVTHGLAPQFSDDVADNVFGIAATGRRVTVSGIEIDHLAGGRVIGCGGELNLSDLSAEQTPDTGP